MNIGERRLMEYYKGNSGSFMTHLFKAIFSADSINFFRLRKAFPQEVDAVYLWKGQTEYAEQLQEEYKNEKKDFKEGSGKDELEDSEA